ncbi:carbohydrate ABC transporter permease [Actinomyces sp. F1_1611]
MARKTNVASTVRTGRYHLPMFIFVALWSLPMLWTLSLSLTPNSMLKTNSQTLWPQGLTLSNYLDVFRTGMTGQWFLNSVVVSVVATVITVFVCATAGYAFAKLSFPGRMLVYALTLAGMMVPKEGMFIPLFIMFGELGLHNSFAGLILPRIAFPLGVFIMTQFFAQVPDEIQEAARMDGASSWRIFYSIMLPLARPALIALATFSFVQTWNDYLWPLVSSTKPEMFTITTGLASLQGTFAQSTELGSLMARGIVGALPLLLLFIFFQKYLIRGITMSSGEK